MKYRNLVIAVPLAIMGSGCGSSGGSDSTSSSSTTEETRTLSGKVIDGYISGATVCIDENNNSICDANELKTMTDNNGSYSFNKVPAGVYQIIASGGKDIVTGADFNTTLLSIVEVKDKNVSDLMVTPVSTLVTKEYLTNKTAGIKTAKDKVKTRLDINQSVDVLAYDFVAKKDSSLFVKNQEVLNSINLVKVVASENNLSNFDIVGTVLESNGSAISAINQLASKHNLSVETAQLQATLVNNKYDSDSSSPATGDTPPITPANVDFNKFMQDTQNSYKDQREQFENLSKELIYAKPVNPNPAYGESVLLPATMETKRQALISNYQTALSSANSTVDNAKLKSSVETIVDLTTGELTGDFKVLDGAETYANLSMAESLDVISELIDGVHQNVVNAEMNSSNDSITMGDYTFTGKFEKNINGYSLDGVITNTDGFKFEGNRTVEFKALETSSTVATKSVKNLASSIRKVKLFDENNQNNLLKEGQVGITAISETEEIMPILYSSNFPARTVSSGSMSGKITTADNKTISFEMTENSTDGTISNLKFDDSNGTKLSIDKITASSGGLNQVAYGFVSTTNSSTSGSGSTTSEGNGSTGGTAQKDFPTPPDMKKLKGLTTGMSGMGGTVSNSVITEMSSTGDGNFTGYTTICKNEKDCQVLPISYNPDIMNYINDGSAMCQTDENNVTYCPEVISYLNDGSAMCQTDENNMTYCPDIMYATGTGTDIVTTTTMVDKSKIAVENMVFSSSLNNVEYSFKGNGKLGGGYEYSEISGTSTAGKLSSVGSMQMSDNGVVRESTIKGSELGDLNISYSDKKEAPLYAQIDLSSGSMFLKLNKQDGNLTAVDNGGAILSVELPKIEN